MDAAPGDVLKCSSEGWPESPVSISCRASYVFSWLGNQFSRDDAKHGVLLCLIGGKHFMNREGSANRGALGAGLNFKVSTHFPGALPHAGQAHSDVVSQGQRGRIKSSSLVRD